MLHEMTLSLLYYNQTCEDEYLSISKSIRWDLYPKIKNTFLLPLVLFIHGRCYGVS